MRYYDITAGDYHWASNNDPNALQIEMDVTLTANDVPVGGYVRVYGVGLEVLKNVQNLFDKDIRVSAGMSGGLPLESANQAGLLFGGKIYQAFGNWEGVDQRVDMIVTAGGDAPAPGPNPKPKAKNIVLDWKKDKPLGPALQKALQQGFPSMKVDMRISDQIKAAQDQLHIAENLEQLSMFVRRWSQQILGGSAPGVSIHLNDKTFNVFDGSQKKTGGKIEYTDLIGQPSWIKPQSIQLKTVMRADIHVGETITVPKTLVSSTQTGSSIMPGSATGMAVEGDFEVLQARHVGNNRQPDGNSWCSVFEAFKAQK